MSNIFKLIIFLNFNSPKEEVDIEVWESKRNDSKYPSEKNLAYPVSQSYPSEKNLAYPVSQSYPSTSYPTENVDSSRRCQDSSSQPRSCNEPEYSKRCSDGDRDLKQLKDDIIRTIQ
jgi:hypothetical protein